MSSAFSSHDWAGVLSGLDQAGGGGGPVSGRNPDLDARYKNPTGNPGDSILSPARVRSSSRSATTW